jgi:hypothetical protein
LLLTDFFTGTSFTVELEKDLSLKKQLLDVVILRKEGSLDRRLPDGLDNLSIHNLITFESHQEALDDGALKERTGHYVNYRKQVSPSPQELLSEEQFRLYAVSARLPRDLPGQTDWTGIQQGVYQCRRGTDLIRVLVLRELPQVEHNAMLHLFSASQEQILYGVEHYQKRSVETSTLLDRLLRWYRNEGMNMSYTLADFRRDYLKEHLKELTPEEILEAASKEKLLAALSEEDRLKGIPAEKLLAALSEEEKAALRQLLNREDPGAKE